MDEQIDVFKV